MKILDDCCDSGWEDYPCGSFNQCAAKDCDPDFPEHCETCGHLQACHPEEVWN